MNILRWLAPGVTALAGWAAGTWLSAEVEGMDEFAGALKPAARVPRASSAASAASSAVPGETEDVVAEADLLRLWKQKNLEATLAAFVAYARKHPEQALELAMNLEGPDAWELVMKLVLQLPPEAGSTAMDVLKRHPQYCEPCPPFDAVFWLCAKFDPERAWMEANAPGVKYTDAALDAIARGCGEINPQLAMTLAERLTQPDRKEKFTHSVLREWSAKDAAGLVSWLGTQEDRESLAARVPWGKMRFDTLADFLAMAKVAPLDLLDGSRGERFSFGTAVEGGWATRTDWLQSLPEGETRQALFAGAARALLGADPEKALALVPELTNARLRHQVLSATAAYRAAVSPEEGFAFANSLTEESARTLAHRSVMRTWAENDPVAAARYALSSHEHDELMAHLGFQWAQIDPQSAVSSALAQEHPETGTSMSSTMLGAAMNRWVRTDPYEASRWVSELPAGPPHDRAISALALGAVHSEPEGAMNWAVSIIDETLRRQTIESGFHSWLNMDRAQAAAWLEQAKLDKSTREALDADVRAAAQEPLMGNSSRSVDGVMVVY